MIFLGGTQLLCNQMRMHISHQGIRQTSHFVFQHHQKRCFLSLKNHVCTTSSFHRATRRNNFMSGIQYSELQFQRSIRSISSSHKVNNDDDDESMRLKVAFLGPPNAGKSTLFNRLMCKESNKSYKLASERISRKPKRSRGRIGHQNKSGTGAIVSSSPGTTRDRRESVGRIGDIFFTLVDTAGVDSERIELLSSGKSRKDPMEVEMMKQTLEAAKNADLIFLLFDAKIGVTTDVSETCRWLRKIGGSTVQTTENLGMRDNNDNYEEWEKKVVILANKLEGDAWFNYHDTDSSVTDHLSEISREGFGNPIPISAEHGEGLADIASVVESLSMKKRRALIGDKVETEIIERKSDVEKEKPLRLAILGKQNVGKSTLVNSLLKENRVIAGDRPGLTRDAIAVKWSWDNRPVYLVDTAGIRRMAKRDKVNEIEDMAVKDAMRAMKVADVAVLVLDAQAKMLQRQELAIADACVREGRALVVAANKMDLLVDAEYLPSDYADGVRKQIELRFPMLRNTPVVAMSSLTGESVEELMPVVFKARDRWAQVINTGILNRWLIDVMDGQAPPIVRGRRAKIKYVIQTKGRPPTFLLFCNVDALPVSYMRYLTNNFQETFGMFGMEVRLSVKTTKNPYHDKDIKRRGGMGIGGSDARKSRKIADLKATGKPRKKGVRRRMQRMQRGER